MFKQSAHQLKKHIVLTTASMYVAVYVVFYLFFSFPIMENVRISLSFLPLAATGYLMGPVVGVIVGGVSDIIAFILKPQGAYFPGYTLSNMIIGLVYGVCLYKSNKSLIILVMRAIIATIIITVFVNMFLNTLWGMILYHKAFKVDFFVRMVKNLIELPFEVIGIVFCVRLHDRTGITKYYI